MTRYRVEWSAFFEGESPLDAAKQAWATLDDATTRNAGPTGLIVQAEDLDLLDQDASQSHLIDMETALTEEV